MSVQSGGQRLLLSMLNEQLTCRLCGGYFIDATTIIECLHSFCRSCIVKYLEKSKYCPICEVQVHKSKPLLNIRPDHTLQDIVYKLVPGCYQNEMRCRREFYAKHPEGKTLTLSPESKGEPIESHIYSPDESLSLSLEYHNPTMKSDGDEKETITKPLPRRYLRCPAAVTVFHLQKLIRAKYGLSESHRVDILHKEEPLCSTYTLMDIMYIYHWRRKVPLHLSYRIFESSPKRIKLSEDNTTFKKSLSDAGIGQVEVQDDQSNKKEWKEVQLKISETGIMSVTDITSPDSKRSQVKDELDERGKTEQAITAYELSKESNVSSEPALKLSNDNTTKNTDSTKKIQEEENTAEMRNGTKINVSNLQNTVATISNDVKVTVTLKNEDQESTNSNTKIEDFKSIPINASNEQSSKTEVELKETKNKGDNHLLTNNNSISSDTKDVECQKQNTKHPNDMKNVPPSAGSKINALSAKLQFQPKVSIINNTYCKKGMKEKKTVTYNCKYPDVKSTKPNLKVESKMPVTTKPQILSEIVIPVTSTSSTESTTVKKLLEIPYTTTIGTTVISTFVTASVTSTTSMLESISSTKTTPSNTSSNAEANSAMKTNPVTTSSISCHSVSSTYVSTRTTPLPLSNTLATSSDKNTAVENVPKTCTTELQQNTPKQEVNSSTLGQVLNTETLSTSQSKVRTSESTSGKLGNIEIQSVSKTVTSSVTVSTFETQNSNTTFSYTVKDLVDKRSPSPGQKVASSVSYSKCPIITSCSVSGSQSNSCMMPQFSMQTPLMSIFPTSTSIKSNLHTSTTTSNVASKSSVDIVPGPCSIPPCPDAIPLSMMKSSMRRNQLPTKGSNVSETCAKVNTPGSKIDDICAKIGENSKEKNKLETRTRPDIPGLLEITKKNESTVKQFPNIHVPIFKPSNMECKLNFSDKEAAKRILSPLSTPSVQPSVSHSTQKVVTSKKRPSPSVYKTLRNPPRSWNPTLSKNNYVAVKNQAKELQNQSQQAAYACESTAAKQIPSKPSKIFTMRNVPRYLGNPASGVKPMYGLVNETKEKEQSTSSSKNVTINMTKIDPQTLSPIVSSPPYTTNDRSYQSGTFSRDICRSTNSPVSPRNSPVNMLSTNPFIPSPTPNTNPHLIYSSFPPSFSNASRFPHSMIPHSPMGLPPPLSAFHSSLPQVQFYQRSSYAPQTSAYAPVNTPPTVQRIPPSSHSSSPKSPKTSSPTATASASTDLPKTEASSAVSTASDSSMTHRSAKVSLMRKDTGAFNLSKSESQTDVNQQIKLDLLAKMSTSNAEAIVRNSTKIASPLPKTSSKLTTTSKQAKPSASETPTPVDLNSGEKNSLDHEAKNENQKVTKDTKTDVAEVASGKDVKESTKEEERKESARVNGDAAGEDAVSESKGKSEEDNKTEVEKTEKSEKLPEKCSENAEKHSPKNEATNGLTQHTTDMADKTDDRSQNEGDEKSTSQRKKTTEQVQEKKSEASNLNS